jgi:hypothetical protein
MLSSMRKVYKAEHAERAETHKKTYIFSEEDVRFPNEKLTFIYPKILTSAFRRESE